MTIYALLTPKGWMLSPAYDINANEDRTGLKLNISENDNILEIDIALEVALYFRLTQVKAKQISESINKAVSTWQSIANKYKTDKNKQDLLRRAFQNS